MSSVIFFLCNYPEPCDVMTSSMIIRSHISRIAQALGCAKARVLNQGSDHLDFLAPYLTNTQHSTMQAPGNNQAPVAGNPGSTGQQDALGT